MDNAVVLLGAIFGVLLFIWFKKTHIIIMTDWFYGNLKLGFGCFFAGWILALILVKLLGGILQVILNIAVLLLIAAFVLAIISGLIILIYGYRHRKEVGSPDKPERTGIYALLDHCTQKLWEAKWFAYGIYGIVIAAIAIFCFMMFYDWMQAIDRAHQTAPQQEIVPQASAPMLPSAPEPEPNPEPETLAPTPLIDLQTLCGEWPIADFEDARCTVSLTDTGEYQITVSKTDSWTGQNEVLGPLILKPVSENCAEAQYDEDGLGHRGTIQIGMLAQDDRLCILISAENNGRGSYDDFTFEMNSALLRPEDIEEERHIALENVVIQYVDGLAHAITEGDFLYVESYLLEDSEIYRTQQDLIANYAERGISETLEDVSVVDYEKIDDTTYRVLSQETIHVTFADGRGKTVEQSYWYTAVQQDGRWLLTDMEEA